MQVAVVLGSFACLSPQHSVLSTLIGAVIPWAVQIGEDGNGVEAVGDGRDGQVVLNQLLKHLIDRSHLRIGARHQDDPVRLQTFVFTALQGAF